MNKSKLNRIYLIVGFLILLSCRETQYNYDCAGASTPTDLTVLNNTDQEVDVVMKVKEDNLNRLKQFNLSSNESTTLCIEYEGPITDGIYIDFNDQTTIIKLRPQHSNEFTLKERTLK